MHHVRRFIERIARRHDLLFFTYRKLELPGEHIGKLFMRVIVHRANRTLLKIELHRHHLS